MTGPGGAGDAAAGGLGFLLEEDAQELYEHAPCGYLSTLADGTIVKVNETFLAWTGYQREALVGTRRFSDLLTAGGRIYHETHYAPLLRMQGSVREIAVDIVTADGRPLPVLVNSALRTDADGTPVGVRTTVFNATIRKEYERELLRARAKAEASEARIRVVHTVVAELAAVPAVGDIADMLVRAGAGAFRATGSSLWTAGPDRPYLERQWSAALPAPLDLPRIALHSSALPAVAVREREVLAAPTATADGVPVGSTAGAMLVAVPLLAENRALGVVCFGFPDERALEPEELSVLRTLGRQAGQALERARLHEEVQREVRRSAFLLEASTVLAAAADFDETIDRLASVAVPALGDMCTIDVLGPDGRSLRVATRHADPAGQRIADELHRDYPLDLTGPPAADLPASVRRSGELTELELQARCVDDRQRTLVSALNITSYLTVPMVAAAHVVGSVTLLSAGSGRRFEPDDVSLAEELASRVGLVVEKAQRYDAERRTSHTLQGSLLPRRLPAVDGLDVAVRYLPSTVDVEVGGDFYDMLVLPSGSVVLVVGDVAGHDIAAAAIMGQLRSAGRALISEDSDPAQLIDRLQHSWDLLGLDRMATALYATLVPGTGDLHIASAGHPPPLLVTASGARYLAVEPGAPLGCPSPVASAWAGSLEPGSTLLLFTDGLVEDRHQDIDAGFAQLAAAAVAAATADPETLCDAIVRTVAGADRRDDIALLAITRR